MCDDCLHLLPNSIKFDLWRPAYDGFAEVMGDALHYLKGLGRKIDIIVIPDDYGKE